MSDPNVSTLEFKGTAAGTVEIRRGTFGPEITVNSRYLLVVDLWHLSEPEASDDPRKGCCQWVIYQTDDQEEPILHIRQYPDGRIVILANDEYRDQIAMEFE